MINLHVLLGTFRFRINPTYGKKRHFGRLEANQHGFWGVVCPAGWTNRLAAAACRDMGYIGGVTYGHSPRNTMTYTKYGYPTGIIKLEGPVVLGEFRCQLNDNQTLSECDSYKGFLDKANCRLPVTGPRTREYRTPAAGVWCYNQTGRSRL